MFAGQKMTAEELLTVFDGLQRNNLHHYSHVLTGLSGWLRAHSAPFIFDANLLWNWLTRIHGLCGPPPGSGQHCQPHSPGRASVGGALPENFRHDSQNRPTFVQFRTIRGLSMSATRCLATLASSTCLKAGAILLHSFDFDPPFLSSDAILWFGRPSAELVAVFKHEIVPLAQILTPNQFEAELLTGLKITRREDVDGALTALHALGVKIVVLTSVDIGSLV